MLLKLFLLLVVLDIIIIIIIASRDDDGGWYDYLQMKWGDLKCLQKPTNQTEIDEGLFPDTV